MSIKNGHTIEENEQYCFILNQDKTTLMFIWKYIEGLSINNFQKAIVEFAKKCKEHKPNYAVIDASILDKESPAVAWLNGQITNIQNEEYNAWWSREIVSMYHDSGIDSLAVGTGDPNAPGELPNTPSEIKFKMGYFLDLESALRWKVN